MGEVYKARDTRLLRTVAIKVLSSDAPYRGERFVREARAQALGLLRDWIRLLPPP